ncbi:MAG: TolC family protein [Lepagella sp.]
MNTARNILRTLAWVLFFCAIPATSLGTAPSQNPQLTNGRTDRAPLQLPADTLPDYSEAVIPADPAGQRLALSRSQCVEIALSHNPTIRVADMEITRADYSKKEVLAQLLPNVSFTGTYQRAVELQTVSMNMGGQSQKFKMGSDNNWSFGFGASVPLVAPQLWKSLQISDLQILANAEQARASRLDMVDQVNRAYYALLLAQATMQVVRKNYNQAVFNADIFRKRYLLGTGTEYDTLRTAVNVRNIEPELLQADIAIRQARLQLKVLLSLPPDAIVVATTSLQALRDEMHAHATALPSLQDNTQLRSMSIQDSILQKNISMQKLSFLPTLGASFSYSWNAMSNGNAFRRMDFNPYSYVALQLSVPLFTGGSRWYGLKDARLQRKELQLQRENLVSSLQMQTELAIDNINREANQIEASQKGMEQAARAYDIMQRSFELGAASWLDLRDSELANTTAQLNYYQAIYNYLVSVSQFDLLLGRNY